MKGAGGRSLESSPPAPRLRCCGKSAPRDATPVLEMAINGHSCAARRLQKSPPGVSEGLLVILRPWMESPTHGPLPFREVSERVDQAVPRRGRPGHLQSEGSSRMPRQLQDRADLKGRTDGPDVEGQGTPFGPGKGEFRGFTSPNDFQEPLGGFHPGAQCRMAGKLRGCPRWQPKAKPEDMGQVLLALICE